jgi:nucleoside-diphosphate-sugar epimerase
VKVLILGATGVVGRPCVRALIERGHEVSAFARGREEKVRALGAEPVDADVYDLASLPRAMEGCDAVVHAATRIPPMAKMWRRSAWAENVRLRTEGAKNLVDAAIAAGVRVYVQHAIAMIYPDRGDAWIGEEVPLEPSPGQLSMIDAERETLRFTEAGHTGIILRNGLFYGPEAASTEDTIAFAKRGFLSFPGRRDAFVSQVHVEDVASATAAALELPAGVYNVIEDDPLTRTELAHAIAEALGVRTLSTLPTWPLSMLGEDARMLMRSQRVSNTKLKHASSWRPKYPSPIEGWREIAGGLSAAAYT